MNKEGDPNSLGGFPGSLGTLKRTHSSGNEYPVMNTKPTLTTREKFYTNMSRDGYTTSDNKKVTLDQYLAELREKFSSVVVMPMAVDKTGRQLENDVAIFVTRNSDKIG